MATPFVQGRLSGRPLTVRIATECGHCGRPLHLHVGSDLAFRVEEPDAEPLLFEPQVDWNAFRGANIIDAY